MLLQQKRETYWRDCDDTDWAHSGRHLTSFSAVKSALFDRAYHYYCWRSWTCHIAVPYKYRVNWLVTVVRRPTPSMHLLCSSSIRKWTSFARLRCKLTVRHFTLLQPELYCCSSTWSLYMTSSNCLTSTAALTFYRCGCSNSVLNCSCTGSISGSIVQRLDVQSSMHTSPQYWQTSPSHIQGSVVRPISNLSVISTIPKRLVTHHKLLFSRWCLTLC